MQPTESIECYRWEDIAPLYAFINGVLRYESWELHSFVFFPGNIVNKADHGSLDWVKICERSTKVITFIDLAGHERYLKTTVFGMTGHAPDFGMLMVKLIAPFCNVLTFNCSCTF